MIELAPVAVHLIAELTVDPTVYDTLGIDDGAELAKRNPHHRARVVDGLAKLTAFLGELGVIDETNDPGLGRARSPRLTLPVGTDALRRARGIE